MNFMYIFSILWQIFNYFKLVIPSFIPFKNGDKHTRENTVD